MLVFYKTDRLYSLEPRGHYVSGIAMRCAREQSARASLMNELIDSALLDYVAFGSTGRCGLRPHLSWSANKNKEEITARAISSLLVDQLGLEPRTDRL